MKPTFGQFNKFVSAPEGSEDEVLSEIFGFFKNNDKVTAAKSKQDELKAQLAAKKKQLADKKWAAAKARIEKTDARNNATGTTRGYGKDRDADFQFALGDERFVKECFGDYENDDVLRLIHDLVNGSADLYDVMYHPRDKTQKNVSAKLKKWYDDTAGEHGLSADDDFDEIKQIMLDELESYSKKHPPAFE